MVSDGVGAQTATCPLLLSKKIASKASQVRVRCTFLCLTLKCGPQGFGDETGLKGPRPGPTTRFPPFEGFASH